MRKKLLFSLSLICLASIAGKASAQSYLLGMVEVNFCNNGQIQKELDLTAKAGNRSSICVSYTNKSTSPITINTEFLDSVITTDNLNKRACNASDRPKTEFGNFLLPYKGNITIASGETIQKEYEIRYPIGFSGFSHGCLAYYIVGTDIQDSDMFTVRIRSIRFADILVSDTKAVQMISISENPRLIKTDDEYAITIGIMNKGNVEEKVDIEGAITNIFGYQQEITFETTLAARTGIILTSPSFILPIYGGPFVLNAKLAYTPQFNFNITDGVHPSKIYAGGTKSINTVFIIQTRQSRVTAIVLIAVITGIINARYRKKRKIPSA